MTSTLAYALPPAESASRILDAIDRPLDLLALPLPDDIRVLQDSVSIAIGERTTFILSVGECPAQEGLENVDWQRIVLTPLRLAFGIATGAARHFSAAGGGDILFFLPSQTIIGKGAPSPDQVLFRALLGAAEALRAEMIETEVRISILFYDPLDPRPEDLTRRLESVLCSGPMYSLSADLTQDRIVQYFAPMLAALEQTSSGPPLPDIGPMAAVYDPGVLRLPRLRPAP